MTATATSDESVASLTVDGATGVTADGRHVTLGTVDGGTRALPDDPDALDASLRAAAATGGLYALDATGVADLLLDRGVAVDTVGLVRSIGVARRSLSPDGTTAAPRHRCAADEAVAAAQAAVALRTAGTRTERAVMLLDVRTDQVWRHRRHLGVRVDRQAFMTANAAVTAAVNEGKTVAGVDLSDDAVAIRWLLGHGIRPAELDDGTITLSWRRWDEAGVPDEEEDAWDLFQRVRRATAVAPKLSELRHHLVGDRVFPQFSAVGTVTRRMTVTDPALQNITGSLRHIFRADDGNVLVSADLTAIEPNVACWVSGDRRLADALDSGDVYAEMAVAVWGPAARKSLERRKVAKTAVLAQLYGQGATGLAMRLGVGEQEAREVVAGLRRAYPELFAWIRVVDSSTRTLGGAWVFDDPERGYARVNYVVQGSAAEVFKRATLAVADRLGSQSLWLPVHDELVVEVPACTADDAAVVLVECLTAHQPPSWAPRLRAETVVHGESWGAKPA